MNEQNKFNQSMNEDYLSDLETNEVVSQNGCTTCQKKKAPYTCGVCQEAVCKACVQFMDDGPFSFWPQAPAQLLHPTYCQACYSQKVAPAVDVYQEVMERAREVTVFLKKQGKETRQLKRLEEPLSVKDIADADEAVLRLAWQAAKLGFNAIIDVDLVGEKLKNGKYQSTSWSATCVPLVLDESQLVKDRSIWQDPN